MNATYPLSSGRLFAGAHAYAIDLLARPVTGAVIALMGLAGVLGGLLTFF